jgi:hypothetical protein
MSGNNYFYFEKMVKQIPQNQKNLCFFFQFFFFFAKLQKFTPNKNTGINGLDQGQIFKRNKRQ